LNVPCIDVPLLNHFQVYSSSRSSSSSSRSRNGAVGEDEDEGKGEGEGEGEEEDYVVMRMVAVPRNDPFIYSPNTPDAAKRSFLKDLPVLDTISQSSLAVEITVERHELEQFSSVKVVASLLVESDGGPAKVNVNLFSKGKNPGARNSSTITSSADSGRDSNQYSDSGGFGRPSAANSAANTALAARILSYITALPLTLHSVHANYKAYDAALFDNFERTCLAHDFPEIRPHEVDLVSSLMLLEDQSLVVTQGSWSLTSSNISPVETYVGPKPYSGTEAWTKTVAEVDAPFGMCTAWCWESGSAARASQHVSDNGNLFRATQATSGRSRFDASVSRTGTGIINRFHFTWTVWMKSADAYYVAFAPATEYGESAAFDVIAAAALRNGGKKHPVETRGFYKIERLAENVSRVTLVCLQKYNDATFPSWEKRKLNNVEVGLLGEWQLARMRRGSDVDAELRRAKKPPIGYEELSDRQRRIVDDAVETLEDRTRGFKWQTVRAVGPFTTSQAYYDPDIGLTIYRNFTAIDADPLSVIAYVTAFCSRKQLNIARENGDPVRVILRRHGDSESETLEVKQMPFWIRDRVFRSCLISYERHGEYLMVSSPIIEDKWDAKANYWKNKKNTKAAETQVLFRISPHESDANMSNVTMHQLLPESYHIPSWLPSSYKIRVPYGGQFLVEVREEFNRDDEIDLLGHAALASLVDTSKAPYTKFETSLLEKALSKMDEINSYNSQLKHLQSPDPFVFISSLQLENDSLLTGKSSTIVDAPISLCATWDLQKMGRARLKSGFAFGGMERSMIFSNDHSYVYRVVYDIGVPGFLPREFVSNGAWLWGKGPDHRKKFLSVYISCDDHPDYPLNSKYVRGFSFGVLLYEEIRPIGSTPQTVVTYFQQVNARGVIPVSFQNTLVVSNMLYVGDMRKFFANSHGLEAGEGEITREMVKKHREQKEANPYDDEEKALLKAGSDYLGIFEDATVKQRRTRGVGGLVRNSAAHKGHGELEGEWYSSETNVRATKEEVLSFLWSMNSKHHWSSSEVERRVLEAKSPHRQVTYACQREFHDKFIHLHARETVSDCVWAEKDDSSILFVSAPTLHPDAGLTVGREGSGNSSGFLKRPVEEERSPVPEARKVTGDPRPAELATEHPPNRASNVPLPRLSAAARFSGRVMAAGALHRRTHQARVVAKIKSAITIKDVGKGTCRIVWVSNVDFGGKVSNLAAGTLLRHNMSLVLRTRYHFEEMRELRDYSPEDGKMLGLRLRRGDGTEKNLGMARGKSRWEMVEIIVEAHRGLREMRAQHPWVVVFLQELVKGKLSFNRPVECGLRSMGSVDARRIGGSLTSALRQRKTPEAGVYQWKMQNPAIAELFEEYPWCEEMVLTIAQDILSSAPWGVVWRVSIGAVLSLLDVGSDLSVVGLYLEDDSQRVFGKALIGMILANLGFQILICFVQQRRNPKEFFREVGLVVLGLKPGYDAYRVATTQVNKLGIVDAKTEMMICKCSEMIFESIPGCLLQTYAFLVAAQNGSVSKRAVTSIIISAITTGLTSATISYDVDTDPGQRRKNPKFYGYVPDKQAARTAMFVCLIFNSAVMIMIRCVGASMLIMVEARYFLWYSAADLSVYMAQKVLRGDYYYHLRIYGVFGFVISGFARIISKMISDYTGIMHFRAAQEVGGIYFTVSMVQAFAVTFASIAVFRSKAEDSKISALMQWWVLGLTSMWLFLFCVTLYLMKKRFRESFFSFQTGAGQTRALFLEAHDDASKSFIFKKNINQWRSIRDDVRVWLTGNWSYFEDTKPEWFDEHFLDLLGEDMLPKEKKQRASNAIVESRQSLRIGVDKKKLMLDGVDLVTVRPGAGEHIPQNLDQDQMQSITAKRRNSMKMAFNPGRVVAVQR
jgi:hypothetical protein